MIDPSLSDDPLMRKLENEIRSLELTNKLERENLKPQLDLKYNTIVNLGKDELNPTFGFNDYKYGITFQVPILNRKTKGELKLNESLIRQNEFDKTQYLGSLTNKWEGLNSCRGVQTELLAVSREKVTNSLLLYEAEQLKFDLGESSVFLLNQRERKLLESQMELVKNYATLSKILNELYYLKLGQL